jgi:hypothetical protein
VFNWGELAFVGIFAAVCIGAIHLIFNFLIAKARSSMGIAAGPRVAALGSQRTQAMALAAIAPAVVVGVLAHGGMGGKKIEWQEYTSERGEYTVNMPGAPVLSQQTQSAPDGSPVVIHSAAVELGRNGSYVVLDTDGPKLTYETGDRGELMNANNTITSGMQATPEQTDFPYPVAWGEVPCAETRAHLNKDPQQLFIIRSWRTGTHTYAAIVAYRQGMDSEAAARRFLQSVRPIGGYQRPEPNHS